MFLVEEADGSRAQEPDYGDGRAPALIHVLPECAAGWTEGEESVAGMLLDGLESLPIRAAKRESTSSTLASSTNFDAPQMDLGHPRSSATW
jgi:hypothetical protein